MTSLRSGCGLQAELAHFASAAMMNFTVSSPGDPHRDSCPTLGEANPPRNNSARRDAGMIDANFIALGLCRLYFSAIDVEAFLSLRTKTAGTPCAGRKDGGQWLVGV